MEDYEWKCNRKNIFEKWKEALGEKYPYNNFKGWVLRMRSILKYVPEGAEVGVGLDLVKEDYHLFFLPGERYNFSENEIFYAGIGGHLEDNESLIECAYREAYEEIGVGIELISSTKTFYLPNGDHKLVTEVNVNNSIKPLVLYEMIHPQGSPKQGEIYFIIIYKAKSKEEPNNFKKDEVSGLLGLTEKQIIKSLNRKPTIQKLIEEGALIIGNKEDIDLNNIVYPIGTAKAIAKILSKLNKNTKVK